MSRTVKMSVGKNKCIADVRKDIGKTIEAAKYLCSHLVHLRLLHIYEKLGHLYLLIDER